MTAEVLNRKSAVPLYVQLGDILRKKIQDGEWAPDEKIPSENELNRMYGLSRMTVRQVLTNLVDEDMLYRVHGKGTFVAHRKISTKSPSYQGIREQLEEQGFNTHTEILDESVVPADARTARALELEVGAPVYRIRRRRLVEGSPLSIHESYVPEKLAPHLLEANLATQQLCIVLERDHGLRMASVHESLESAIASKSEAEALDARPGAPVLLLQQHIRHDNGVMFEFTKIVFRGDKVKLDFQYNL
ncbi:GntR family transcriptional regulator [Propionibacteriaceae bacterium G1746]|uniref:GntR family transcriptional regulator n=1 Tax=Aestuariimicrobium sp. G57 TaxID=3418485 RepID=UPI003C1BAEDB